MIKFSTKFAKAMQCGKKVRFLDKGDADKSIHNSKVRRSYFCKFCSFWHVGHIRKDRNDTQHRENTVT